LPDGVVAGRELFNDSILRRFAEEKRYAADAFREICNQLNSAKAIDKYDI